MPGRKPNAYGRIIERVFRQRFRQGMAVVPFERSDIEKAAKALRIPPPKNLGDVVYTFRSRAPLPQLVLKCAPKGQGWIIRGAGSGRYRFVAAKLTAIDIRPSPVLAETKVPDATPGVIARYILDAEQALLAKLRYNRLLDIFTGVTCYPLQSHLVTHVSGLGQVETDEIYVGIDRRGVHYVIPVQAKSGKDRIGVVQIEQDLTMCAHKFPNLICRPIAAQFMANNLIALFEFEDSTTVPVVTSERHYRLVPQERLSDAELRAYQDRLSQ